MNDRELLEMAAKSAGLEIIKHRQDERDMAGYGSVGLYVRDRETGFSSTGWNPLNDDGDALRLAVSLGISYEFDKIPASTEIIRVRVWGLGWHKENINHGVDVFSATRQAIVRAAAEIGKSIA